MAKSAAERQRAFRQRQRAAKPQKIDPVVEEQRKKALHVTDSHLAMAGSLTLSGNNVHDASQIFTIPLHPPQVVPKGRAMAMDDFGGTKWAQENIGLSTSGGVAFFGYPLLSELAQRPEYRVISETIASEMTRKWIKLKAKGDTAGKSDKINAIESELIRLKVRDNFRLCTEHDGYFGRAHLYMEFVPPETSQPPTDDELMVSVGEGTSTSVTSKLKVGPHNKLERLKVVEPVWCYPVDYNTTDPLRADWYKPGAWFAMGKQIHSTRLLTFIGRAVPDLLKPSYSFGGLSMSQMAKPYVDNWLRTRSSVADLIYSFSVMVLSTNMGESLNSENSGDDLFRRTSLFTKMRSNSGTMVIDKELEELTNVAAPLGTLDSLQAQTQEHMACLKGDTLIETARGQIAIKDVTTDDRVMTRNGYAPVAWAGVTKYASRMVRIETDDSVVLCTEEHPIWVESENRFVLAENVNLSHRLRKSPAWENTALEREHGEQDTRIIDARFVDCDLQPVYDITVSDGFLPEFYANGVLVHNSVSRIPLVKLTGISPSGLNASSDGEIRCFYDFINASQELQYRDHLTTIIGFIQLGLYGEIDPEIDFEFEALYSLDEKGKAELRQIDAATDEGLIERRIISRVEARKRIADDPNSLYPSLDTDAVPVLEDSDKASYATAVAGAVGGLVQAQIIDQATALKELLAAANVAGIFSQITSQDVEEAEMAPPPGSQMMPGQPGMPPGVPGAGPPGHTSDPSPGDDPSAQPPTGGPPKGPPQANGGAPPAKAPPRPMQSLGQDEFNPSEPRKSDGEWTSGGGGVKRDTLDLSSPTQGKSNVKRDIMDISSKVDELHEAVSPSPEKVKQIWDMVHHATKGGVVKDVLGKTALYAEKTGVKVIHRQVANKWVDPLVEAACAAALLYFGMESPLVEGVAVALAGWVVDQLIDKTIGEEKAAELITDALRSVLHTLTSYPDVPKKIPDDAMGVAADSALDCIGLLRLIHILQTTPIDELREAGNGFDITQLLGPRTAQDEFIESEHPRGQPGNAGEFGPGGGGKKAKNINDPPSDIDDDVPAVVAKPPKKNAPPVAKGDLEKSIPDLKNWSKKEAAGQVLWTKKEFDNSKAFMEPAFHGTTSDVVSKILKEGIRPGVGGGGDDWCIAHGGSIQRFSSGAENLAERKASTYIAADPAMAASFANMVATMHKGAKPVILAVQIPAKEIGNIVQDEGFNNEPAYRFKGAIKPEWIRALAAPKGEEFPGVGRTRVLGGGRAMDVDGESDLILYLVPITGEPQDDDGIAQDEFIESQHPRGQPQNAGEFVKGGGPKSTSPKSQPSGVASTLGGGNQASNGVMFVSPNVAEGVTFRDAAGEVQGQPSQRLQVLHKASDEIDRALNIKTRTRSAIGAWADGAESSVMSEVDGASFRQLRLAAAMKGYLADQKAVLVFKGRSTGTSVLFHFKATGNISTIHNALLEDGVAFHTLVPTKGGADVYVADLDGSALDAVEKAAKRYDGQIDATHGDAEFIGTQKEDGTDREQRDDARQSYAAVIGSERDQGSGSIWNRIHSTYGDSLQLGANPFLDVEPQVTGKSNGVPLTDPVSVEDHIRKVAAKLGYLADRVHFGGVPIKQTTDGIEGALLGVSLEHDETFNGKTYHKGDIVLFGDQGTGIPADGVIAHEIMHKKFGTAMQNAVAESSEITPDMVDDDGQLLSDAAKKRFPSYAALSPYFAWGFPSMYKGRGVPRSFEDLMESDGITPYSKAYWSKFSEDGIHMSVWLPINETLAEIAKIETDPAYKSLRQTVKPIWRDAYNAVNKLYDASREKWATMAQDDAQSFDPNEPRKADGEWTTGGGSSKLASLTVNSILRSPSLAIEKGYRTVETIADELNRRGSSALKELGVRAGKIEEQNPKTDTIISHAIASEVEDALKRPGASSAGWYSQKIKEAIQTASELHPEITKDDNAKMAFLACLAITSQGEKVVSNVRLADRAYSTFKETGKFPEDVEAKAGPQMENNFAKLNAMIAKGGIDATREFLAKQFSVRDLIKLGYKKPQGQKMDAMVYGSSILGPKIGNGFYQNLIGNFNPVTVDLWFMRAWGRLTGTLVGGSEEALASQRERLENALRAEGQDVPKTAPGLEKLARDLFKKHETDFFKNREQYDSGEKKKSELAMAAQRYIIGRTGIVEQPSSAGQREWMRDCVMGAIKILKDKGIDITPADLQATWWYPEKMLYEKLGGRDSSDYVNKSYAEAFADMVKERRAASHG